MLKKGVKMSNILLKPVNELITRVKKFIKIFLRKNPN